MGKIVIIMERDGLRTAWPFAELLMTNVHKQVGPYVRGTSKF